MKRLIKTKKQLKESPVYLSDLKHPSKSLEEKLHKLYTLNRDKKIDLSFRPPYLELLEKLGNPHLNLPPTIHVAGTNGKGSIIATLKSIYEAAGYSVHAYTSPHLIQFNERIVINGEPIANEPLESLIDEALEKNAGASCTFFEITTAIAFAAFARSPADICLLEVGLGGRLDCTNVIINPMATIINTIGKDHTEFLGDTYEQIAAEKAGIMKAQTPCIIGAQNNDKAHQAFESKAKEIGCKLVQHKALLDHFDPPALKGAHQIGNINTALTAIEVLQDQLPVTDKHINQGLKSIEWPARMQKLPGTAFKLHENTTLWLDGGHNEDAGNAIAAHFKNLKAEKPATKIAVILCMLKHKNPREFVDTFIEHCDELYVTQLPDEPFSLSADELSDAVSNIQHETSNTYKDALNNAKKQRPDHILITGSLYLAGQILQDLRDSGHNK